MPHNYSLHILLVLLYQSGAKYDNKIEHCDIFNVLPQNKQLHRNPKGVEINNKVHFLANENKLCQSNFHQIYTLFCVTQIFSKVKKNSVGK